jgi:hypothetical protein
VLVREATDKAKNENRELWGGEKMKAVKAKATLGEELTDLLLLLLLILVAIDWMNRFATALDLGRCLVLLILVSA